MLVDRGMGEHPSTSAQLARADVAVGVGSNFLEATAARRLTDEVKADAQALWSKLLGLYEGRAHEALGYSSWGSYYEAEFGGSKSAGYRLLEAARVVEDVVPNVGNEDLPAPPTVHHAQALSRLPEREARRDAWTETVERHGPTPTAAQTAEVVRERLPGPKTAFAQAAASGEAVLDSTGHWQTGRDPEDEGGIHWLSFQSWSEDIDKMPDPRALVVPRYGTDAYAFARRVRSYIDDFLDSHPEGTS